LREPQGVQERRKGVFALIGSSQQNTLLRKLEGPLWLANLCRSEGNDALDGGGGDDHVEGDSGSDTVIAGEGSDTVVSDAGDDLGDFAFEIVAPISLTAGSTAVRGQELTIAVDFPDPASTLSWTFGDGATGDGAAVRHAYSSDGMNQNWRSLRWIS
jgi:Ca2+-binding RTX toxin-like protein